MDTPSSSLVQFGWNQTTSICIFLKSTFFNSCDFLNRAPSFNLGCREECDNFGLGRWALILVIPVLIAYYWDTTHGTLSNGEPPLVPYWLPWLGHGLSFMSDSNAFVAWVRSLYPEHPAATVQVAGQHMYLIFDSVLASQVYRQSQTFIFDPFILMAIGVAGGNKNDLEIVERGSQTVNHPLPNPDNQHFIHDLHKMTPQHLTGKPLDKLTNMFIEVLCKDIDTRFPENDPKSYEWETMDICEYVRKTWAHAAITSLFGTNIVSIWPEVGTRWLWEFDEHFQSLMTKLPRFMLPKAYALRDEGWEKSVQWEREALEADAAGLHGEDPDWDPHWGLRFARLRVRYLIESGLSEKVRAGNQMVFIWGLNSNSIPIAMQTINQTLLHPEVLESILKEIEAAKTGPISFNMKQITSLPKFKSVYLESLRWATASPSPRVVKEDIQLGQYKLKKGNMVVIHSHSLQMDPKTWTISGIPESDPANFWPDRFLTEDESKRDEHSVQEIAEAEENYSNDVLKARRETEKHAQKIKEREEKARMLSLRPFGGGTTMCPGRYFANNEIMGGIAALLLRLEIEVVQEELEKNGAPKPNMKQQGGLLPDRPLIVRVRRRKAA